MIRAQGLNRTLVIQSAVEVRDSHGQAIETWVTFATVYGELKPISGRERVLSVQTTAEATYRLRIRWIAGLTEKMRISYDSKIFNITYIADDGGRRELVLDLSEGVNDG